jgi:hypothetical protein
MLSQRNEIPFSPWQWLTAAILTAPALLAPSGCVALGWRFGPGLSVHDTALFSEPPVVVHRDGAYALAWTQGTNPFFFEPSYKAIDGRLVFALVTTASSGNLAGRPRAMTIEGAENIAALEHGGACWWEPEPEPGGACVELRRVEQMAAVKP